jgi:hypothetical protein
MFEATIGRKSAYTEKDRAKLEKSTYEILSGSLEGTPRGAHDESSSDDEEGGIDKREGESGRGEVQGEKKFAADFGGRQEVGAEVHMSSLQNDDQSKNEDGVHVEKPSDWSHGSLQEST